MRRVAVVIAALALAGCGTRGDDSSDTGGDTGGSAKVAVNAPVGDQAALRVTAAVADGSSTVTLDGPPVAPAPPAGGHSLM